MALELSEQVRNAMVTHCFDAYPLEGCGLLAATTPDGSITRCFPMRNAAASARIYELDPREHLQVDREADDAGLVIVGVFHSHTHTAAYPSATDIAQAPVPDWHYVLVSFENAEVPAVRSYRIAAGGAEEEAVNVVT